MIKWVIGVFIGIILSIKIFKICKRIVEKFKLTGYILLSLFTFIFCFSTSSIYNNKISFKNVFESLIIFVLLPFLIYLRHVVPFLISFKTGEWITKGIIEEIIIQSATGSFILMLVVTMTKLNI